MNTLRFEPIVIDVQGIRTLFVLPTVPNDAPEHVREGITRRRVTAITGTCPCGAERPKLTRQQLRRAKRKSASLQHLEVHHEDDCPALDEALVTWIREAGLAVALERPRLDA